MPNSPIYLPFKRGIAISEIPTQKPLLKDEICHWMLIIPKGYTIPLFCSHHAIRICAENR